MDPQSAFAISARLTGIWIQRCARRGIHPKPISPGDLLTAQILAASLPRPSGVTSTPQASSSAQPSGSRSRPVHGLENTIINSDRDIDKYEQPELLDEALSHIPIQELYETAEALKLAEGISCFEDGLAEALVKWFKPEFFAWIDPIKCPKCDGATRMSGFVQPTSEESNGQASRVELHVCNKENGECDGQIRFPRYNDPAALLRSRKGRCGEFANLFTLMLRAVGLRTRYVWNLEDHVWNEYYSPSLNRWVHLDSCECIRDQHLLYNRGWGKKMSYVIAFSVDGAQDVTRGYVLDWEETLERRKQGPEDELQKILATITARRRFGFSDGTLDRLNAEDKAEMKWLAESQDRIKEDDRVKEEGRKSGTEEWKEARGETGGN